MRIFILTIILFNLFTKQCIAQALTWEGEDIENKFYYPEKKDIKDNNVKFKIDSNKYSSRGYWIEAFDLKGRLIGSFNHSIDSFSNPYRYIETNDTLLRLRLRDKDASLYMLERFIYNSNGKIIQFDRFYDDVLDKQLELSRTVFYYKGDTIITKLRYSSKAKEKLTHNYTVETNNMKLWSAKHYTYQRTKLYSLMIVQENVGEPDFRDIDTFKYDNNNRLLRHVNFAKRAYVMHNATANDVKYVEIYKYKNDSVFIQSYRTSSLSSTSQTEIDYKIKIFNNRGLEIRNFHGYTKEKIELYDRIKYIYY